MMLPILLVCVQFGLISWESIVVNESNAPAVRKFDKSYFQIVQIVE